MKAIRIGAVVLVLSAVAMGCAQEGGGRPSTLDITAVDFGFQGVDKEIRGGVVDLTFTNAGEATHEFAIIDAGDDSADDFKDAIGKVLEGGPIPDSFEAAVVPFEATPGETKTTSFTLPEGNYFLFCALTDEPGGEGERQPQGDAHYDLGMLQELTVDEVNERELEADGGEFVAKDYSFDIPANLQAGERTYVFRNAGPDQWHHMVINEYPEGTTEEEAIDAFRTLSDLDEGEAPPEGMPMGDEIGGGGVFSPGGGHTVTLDLKAGRTYLALCFIQDKEGGPPHAFAHKMMKSFTVAG